MHVSSLVLNTKIWQAFQENNFTDEHYVGIPKTLFFYVAGKRMAT